MKLSTVIPCYNERSTIPAAKSNFLCRGSGVRCNGVAHSKVCPTRTSSVPADVSSGNRFNIAGGESADGIDDDLDRMNRIYKIGF